MPSIDLAILGLLKDQDLHGYELRRLLGDLLGPWSSVSFGSLYPALARLERRGDVAAVPAESDEPDTPMTGALSGELAAFRHRVAAKGTRGRRGKKVYRLTTAGDDRFHDLLTQPGTDDERSFSIRVAFCQHVSPDERLALFERRRADLAAHVAKRGQSRHTGPSDRRGDPYRRLLRDRDNRTLTNDLQWIDELVAATETETNPDVIDPAAPAASTPGGTHS